jgi:chloramphenicol-sensitive protein RarD
MLLSLPACLWFILAGGHMTEAINIEAIGLVTGLGLLSALALGFQALSAPLLNLSLFGLLVYVEPVLLLGVSLLLGEVIDPREWPTYIAIWLAVVVLMVEGAWGLHNRRYAPEKTALVAE